jgi:GTP 3',8-cyclase
MATHWNQRSDRYSEERNTTNSTNSTKSERAEMAYLGG